MGQDKIISELMESIVNEIEMTLSSKDIHHLALQDIVIAKAKTQRSQSIKDMEVDNEDFLVHSELLKDVHLELKVKSLLPRNLYSDIVEMYKTRYQFEHKKKLTRVHHNLLLSHVHYDLDSVLNYAYCENQDCKFGHDENEFNVLNKDYTEGKVLNITHSYCCKHCYSYDKWSKQEDFKKLWNRDPEHGRFLLEQRERWNPQDSIQLDNFRIYMNENWEI